VNVACVGRPRHPPCAAQCKHGLRLPLVKVAIQTGGYWLLTASALAVPVEVNIDGIDGDIRDKVKAPYRFSQAIDVGIS
jgi:hypothetical protein